MTELPLEPLFFSRLLKEKVWGGSHLSELLGAELPFDGPLGETWECSDVPGEETNVLGGNFDGQSLRELMRDRFDELLGDSRPTSSGRFPLLVKFIDAGDDLSVQVHPPDGPSSPTGVGKTEAWYALGDRGSVICGLDAETSRAGFEAEADSDRVESHLHELSVKQGDFIFVPAGQVHAIRANTMLCEIQQTSDVTYRLYDWGRVGLDGKPRQTHLQEALSVVDYGLTPGEPFSAQGKNALLTESSYFRIFSHHLTGKGAKHVQSNNRAHVFAVVDGQGSVQAPGFQHTLGVGDVFLLPASVAEIEIQAEDSSLTFIQGEAL